MTESVSTVEIANAWTLTVVTTSYVDGPVRVEYVRRVEGMRTVNCCSSVVRPSFTVTIMRNAHVQAFLIGTSISLTLLMPFPVSFRNMSPPFGQVELLWSSTQFFTLPGLPEVCRKVCIKARYRGPGWVMHYNHTVLRS